MVRTLPIWQLEYPLLDALRKHRRFVLVAPTGSGKTTQVPQMALDAGLARPGQRIVVLQPRRVAARTVAARVAWERNSSLGAEIGYQIRFEDRTSLGTRICFVTEGILLRWLQDDPHLNDTDVILFDEFHERNLLSDVALALAKRLQETARPDLSIGVMSATLDAEPVAHYLSIPDRSEDGRGPCPILISEGQMYPVDVRYLTHQDSRPITEQASDAVEQIVKSGAPGDILVFMPGMAEINATLGALRAARFDERLDLIPLHGDLPPEEQDRAFAPSNRRKIIVATNVAETSVTIEGIRHVVDSGLARIARYDPERGISTLFVEEISRASADQRKGRAGRTAPGTCYRLWTESGHLNRPERNTPEIQRSDLAEVVLLLHSLHIHRAAEFDWLDKPDPLAVERAEKLLRILGALDEPGELTHTGRQMLKLPMHPRYSRMMVEAFQRDCASEAALCAALVSGRDLLVRLGRDDKHIAEARELFEASQESDFFTLMLAFRFAKRNQFSVDRCRRYGIHAQTARQVDQTYGQILDLIRRFRPQPPEKENDPAIDNSPEAPAQTVIRASSDPLLRCIMTGFIDQLCVRRDRGSLECDLTEERHGTLMRESVVQNAPLFVAALIKEVTGRGSEPLILLGLASAVKLEWVRDTFPRHVNTRVLHVYDRVHKRVAAVRQTRFLDLVIEQEHQREADPALAARCLAEAYQRELFELPLFNHEVRQFIGRVNLVASARPELEFPFFSEAAIIERLSTAFTGLTLVKEAQAVHLKETFFQFLAPEQREWLDELAPVTIAWPDGRKLKLLYPESARNERGELNLAEVQVKLHECFQLSDHPMLCEGKIPVRLWLTAPDGKRLDSTTNWPLFKASVYPKLKPALQQKYSGVAWI